MLTIITNPSDFNFSKSPIICEIETDNYMQNDNFGLRALGIFGITGSGGTGQYIRLVSSVLTIQLDFVVTTSASPGILRTRAAGDSYTDYWNKLLADILLNTSITSLYTVTQDGLGGFFFLANSPGPNYSLTASVTSGPGLNFFNNTVGTDDIRIGPRENYKIGIDVLVERSMGFPTNVLDKIVSFEKEPVNDRVKMDLSKFIDTQLEYYFPTPNQSTSNICNQVCKHFQVTVREVYGNPAAEQLFTLMPPAGIAAPGSTSTFEAFVLKAGLAPIWNKKLPSGQLAGYVFSYPLLLTTRHPYVKITKFQPEYLFFCFPANCANPVLKIATKLKTGAVNITFQSLYSGTMFKGFVGCFPINPVGSTIYNLVDSGTVEKFTVTLVSNSDTSIDISGGIIYTTDETYKEDNKVFLCTNSFGGIDTIRTTGNYMQNVEFEKEISSRNYYTTDESHLGTEVENQQTKQNIFKVNSGWLIRENLIRFEELFLAKYKVEVIDLLTYMPITITSKKYLTHETNENLYAIEFEYYHQLKSIVTDTLSASI